MAEKVILRRVGRQKAAHAHDAPPKAHFCPECGEALDEYQEIEERKCGACEHIVQPTDHFCWQCGEELVENGTEQFYDEEGTELTSSEFKKAKEKKVGKKAGAVTKRSVVEI